MKAFQFFQFLSIFYIFVGLSTLVRFVRGWRLLWDDQLTADDARLASRAAFFLLVPPTVALHEFGHAVAIWFYDLQVVDWQFLGYMGAVLPSGSAGAEGDFVIALAGNLVTFFIGIAAIGFALIFPGHPVRNILAIELGRQELFLVLVFYPLICVSFPGDWATIYDFSETPLASGVVAVFHALIVVVGYGIWWKRRLKIRAILLCSGAASAVVEAERRVAENADDFEAHQRLGTLLHSAGDDRGALFHLGRVMAAGAADARSKLVYGSALVDTGRAAEALLPLSEARASLLSPEERRAAELVSIRAEIVAGRSQDALARADGLRVLYPSDPAVTVLWARAMKAGGKRDEARRAIEDLLDRATEPERPVLRRLFEELR